MKRLGVYKKIVAIALIGGTICAESDFQPRLLVRQPFPLVEDGLVHYHGSFGHTKEQSHLFFPYVLPFYTHSHNGSKLARCFLPNAQRSASVRENGLGDIGSLWLGLSGPPGQSYNAEFSIRPEVQSHGVLFKNHFNWNDYAEGYWSTIVFFVEHVEHNLNLKETCFHPVGRGSFPSIGAALENPLWEFGKWLPGFYSSTGISDIFIQCGHDWDLGDRLAVGWYGLLGVPTGSKPRRAMIFSPGIDNSSVFWNIGTGFSLDAILFERARKKVVFMFEAVADYDLPRTILAPFDTKNNGPWSRYLLVARKEDPGTPLPGINVLTQLAQFTPGASGRLWLGVHGAWGNYNAEAGYIFSVAQEVKVRLASSCLSSFPSDIGIFDLARKDTPALATSSSKARINQSTAGTPNPAPSDPEFVALTVDDLDLKSAAPFGLLMHKFYMGTSYHHTFYGNPALLGTGVSYQHSSKNCAVEQWAVWVTTGINF